MVNNSSGFDCCSCVFEHRQEEIDPTEGERCWALLVEIFKMEPVRLLQEFNDVQPEKSFGVWRQSLNEAA